MKKFIQVITITIAFLFVEAAQATLLDGLMTYYPFNGDTNDASSNGNHGVDHGGPLYVGGVCGQAISLDGVDDYIIIPHSESFAFSSAITISIWLKSGYQDQSYIMHKFDCGGSSTNWAFNLTGKQGLPLYSVAFGVWGQSTVSNDYAQARSYTPDVWNNQWHHIAATYNRNIIKLYIDGNLAATAPYDKLINDTDANILIGADCVGHRYPMELDELKIYDRALSEYEIQQLSGVPEPVLVVEIDIKPGSYPNAINLGSHGLTPVAIFSMVGFDATSVEPNTVNLAGAPVATRGKTGEKFMAHEEDVDGDGLVDLVVQVVTADINPALLQLDGDVIYAVLTGNTSGGEAIEGEDEIIIVPPK